VGVVADGQYLSRQALNQLQDKLKKVAASK
jgi:hypothetical protein